MLGEESRIASHSKNLVPKSYSHKTSNKKGHEMSAS
jgi:hypothetical protein